MLHSNPRKAEKKKDSKSNIHQIMWNVKQKQKTLAWFLCLKRNGLFCRFLASLKETTDFPGKADFPFFLLIQLELLKWKFVLELFIQY